MATRIENASPTKAPLEYWHGFMLSDKISFLTANQEIILYRTDDPSIPRTSKPQIITHHLIGFIKSDNKFQFGFINRPYSEYNCFNVSNRYSGIRTNVKNNKNTMQTNIRDTLNILKETKVRDKSGVKDSDKVLTIVSYIIDCFTLFIFDTFLNTANTNTTNNAKKFIFLENISKLLIQKSIDEDLNVFNSKTYPNKTYPTNIILFVKEFINTENKVSLISYIINKITTDPSSKINKQFSMFLYTLSKLSKQHPLQNCDDKNKIVNPNEFYTEKYTSLGGTILVKEMLLIF